MQSEEVYSLQRPPKSAKTESLALSFSKEDVRGVIMPHDDAWVMTLTVANHVIHRILVDNISSFEILYWSDFKQMGIDRDRIKTFCSPLVGFAGEQVQPIGLISFPIIARTAPKQSTVLVDFLAVDRPSTYNAIIGWPTLNKWRAVTSTYYLMMKFPTEKRVGEVKGDRVAARRCYNTSMKKVSDSTTLIVGIVVKTKGEPTKPLEMW
jgi:hypothetical protein